jgi:hypothetical protein
MAGCSGPAGVRCGGWRGRRRQAKSCNSPTSSSCIVGAARSEMKAQTERSFYGDPPLFDQATFGLERKLKMEDCLIARPAELIERRRSCGCMELEPQLGVSWLCLTFQSIRSCVSARARRSYCAAQPKAVNFLRKAALSTPDRPWQDLLQSFEAARDEWSAMEAVVHLELRLEAEGLLIEERTAYASRSGQGRSRAA